MLCGRGVNALSKTIENLNLPSEHLKAIYRLSLMLKELFPVIDIAIFGSTARGEAREGSDQDLLIITSEKVPHEIMNKMYGLVFEINLEFGTNISIVIVDADSWHRGIMTLTPLYKEVQRDGVFLSE